MLEKLQAVWDSLLLSAPGIAWKIVTCILVLIIGNAVIKFLCKRIENSKADKKLSDDARGYVNALIKGSLYVIMIIVIVSIIGIPMASVIAVLASAGAAVALALQGTLANFAAGIMLLVFKPIHVGNYIEAAGTAGTVADLGLFSTTLTTPDNKTVFIPNGQIIGGVITNYSLKDTRRVDVTFGVAYGTDTEAVKETVMAIANAHEKVLKDPAPFLRMTEMADSSLNFTVRVWVNSADYWGVKFDLNESIVAALAENNISIPFPQLDVHIVDNDKK
ncbi:MAG: mechanosensitive ion channel [Clostridia bacterium]|nr:mechanosensitive ion channel [Clostridia bacterium]